MPRTKKPTKTKDKNDKVVSNNDSEELKNQLILLKEQLEDYYDTSMERLEAQQKTFTNKMIASIKAAALDYPSNIMRKTMGELKNASLESLCKSTAASFLSNQSTAKDRTRLKRSNSSVDEGYLTSGNSTGTTGRLSRSRSKKVAMSGRTSRSYSRSRVDQSVSKSTLKKGKSFKTPLNSKTLKTFGTVTPKMKPNTPQLLLRRPQLGEVVMSMQGSPIFTGSVTTDEVANVNIPLQDGRLLSLQPQRGLRVSQIPDLDAQIKKQLLTLRDNLNKMVGGTQ